MIDLHTARQAYWEQGQLLSYQDLWAAIRIKLATSYQQVVCHELDLEDDILAIKAHGQLVARFEIR